MPKSLPFFFSIVSLAVLMGFGIPLRHALAADGGENNSYEEEAKQNIEAQKALARAEERKRLESGPLKYHKPLTNASPAAKAQDLAFTKSLQSLISPSATLTQGFGSVFSSFMQGQVNKFLGSFKLPGGMPAFQNLMGTVGGMIKTDNAPYTATLASGCAVQENHMLARSIIYAQPIAAGGDDSEGLITENDADNKYNPRESKVITRTSPSMSSSCEGDARNGLQGCH